MIPPVERPDLAALPDALVLEGAFHARRRGDHEEARQRFLTVFQRDQTNPFVLIEAARCDGARLDFGSMREFLREAAARAEGDPLVWQMIGEAWLAFHFPEDARAAYEAGRALDPDDPELTTRLLAVLERANRLDEAQALLGELPPALRRTPALQPVRAAMARRQGQPEKAVEWTDLLLREVRLPTPLRIHAEWERARALDALGLPHEAWAGLRRAKTLLAANPESEFERRLFPSHLAYLRSVEQRFTQGLPALWKRQAADAPPRRIAFLLGHPRSGTTLLERILDAHPDIAAASEFPTFERCMVEVFAQRPGVEPILLEDHPPGFDVVATRARYWGLMEGALPSPIGSRLLLDKNPGLTEGLHGIVRVFPEARLLVMLRDPRDVILSCFFQDFGWTRLGVATHTLEGAVTAWEATMGHWVALRDRLPPEQWREVKYESFVEQADARSAEILAFLGCANSDLAATDALGREGFIRTPTYHQIGSRVRQDAVGRWRAYREHFEPYRGRLAPLFAALGYAW